MLTLPLQCVHLTNSTSSLSLTDISWLSRLATKDHGVESTIKRTLSKVPAVTLGFWVIKIAATTLGRNGRRCRDHVHAPRLCDRERHLYLYICRSRRCPDCGKIVPPFLYWSVIIANTTTAGTTMADFAGRSLGIGYTGGAAILFVLLIAALGLWCRVAASISVDTITTLKIEAFYWSDLVFPNPGHGAAIGWQIRPVSITKVARLYSALA